jgi:hypothetical protein
LFSSESSLLKNSLSNGAATPRFYVRIEAAKGAESPLEGAEPTVEEQRLGTLLALLGFQLIHDTGPPEPIMQESLT